MPVAVLYSDSKFISVLPKTEAVQCYTHYQHFCWRSSKRANV